MGLLAALLLVTSGMACLTALHATVPVGAAHGALSSDPYSGRDRPALVGPTATLPEVEGEVVAWPVPSPPTTDGRVDSIWEAAEPVQLPLTYGRGGTEHALDLTLRAVYTDQAIYFLAQWHGKPPSGEADTVYNMLTLHWRIPEAQVAARSLSCATTCHTAFADGQGQFVYANAETIPKGGSEALSVAGGWEGDAWTLEWSRALASANPIDLQLTDRDQGYRFFVKLFERMEDQPDPVSGIYLLVFRR
jgi:hypothetical protein